MQALSDGHIVGDARRLPLAVDSIDAVATEPPYDAGATEVVVQAFRELALIVRTGGRIAVLCAESQAEPLLCAAEATGCSLVHQEAIDRKGVACRVIVCERG